MEENLRRARSENLEVNAEIPIPGIKDDIYNMLIELEIYTQTYLA